MSFFKKFPTTNYKIDGYDKAAMNIVTAAILKRINIDKTFVYQPYVIPAGKTPESLAYDLYRDPNLCWVFFLVNGMVNPLNDWPMSDEVLEEHVLLNHDSIYDIVYFTDLEGFRLDEVQEKIIRDTIDLGDPIPADVHPATAIEEAARKNREKGNINIVSAKFINQFVDLFNKAIEGKI